MSKYAVPKIGSGMFLQDGYLSKQAHVSPTHCGESHAQRRPRPLVGGNGCEKKTKVKQLIKNEKSNANDLHVQQRKSMSRENFTPFLRKGLNERTFITCTVLGSNPNPTRTERTYGSQWVPNPFVAKNGLNIVSF